MGCRRRRYHRIALHRHRRFWAPVIGEKKCREAKLCRRAIPQPKKKNEPRISTINLLHFISLGIFICAITGAPIEKNQYRGHRRIITTRQLAVLLHVFFLFLVVVFVHRCWCCCCCSCWFSFARDEKFEEKKKKNKRNRQAVSIDFCVYRDVVCYFFFVVSLLKFLTLLLLFRFL